LEFKENYPFEETNMSASGFEIKPSSPEASQYKNSFKEDG